MLQLLANISKDGFARLIVRANYVQTYYGCDWKDPHRYQTVLSSTLGSVQAGWIIIDAVEQ